MRARASFKGHAIHQMLIPFPLAFLAGALLFDLAGFLLGAALWQTAGHLAIAGVLAAVAAALPGSLDLFGSVPPRSSGRTRGYKHAAANLSATALFLLAWFLRPDGGVEPGWAVLGAELVGGVLLGMGGWMGGTLVARNQIGVDHRYARAGKWKERKVEGDWGGPVRVADRDELQVDQMMLVHLAGKRIVLARTEDGFAAFDDGCTHRGASLADGSLVCGTVQCPWHGSQFDVHTGACRAGPAEEGVRAYRVDVQGDDVRIVP